MARSPRIPKYRRHSSGQARVTFNAKDYLLGPYGSAESREAYQRLVAEWLANPGKLAEKSEDRAQLTIEELILAYWKFAKGYYGFENGRGDGYCLRDVLRVIRHLYGQTPASQFGPKALKVCRQAMIEKNWSRTYTNAQVDRIRRMFRWAAEEELLPGSLYQDLRAVAGLRPGKTAARETKKVRPVPHEQLDASLPLMPPMIKAMAQLQLLSGCRPDEVCRIRPFDIDMDNVDCWLYRPGSDEGHHGGHKTAHHGHDRMIFLGPKGQEVLRPYLNVERCAFCFCPAEGESRRNALRKAMRKAPMTPSQARRRPKKNPRHAPRERYDPHSYRRAIARACKRAGVPAWSPNRLRHNRARELRHHGLDVTKTILGHSKVEATQLYAEKDVHAAMALMARLG